MKILTKLMLPLLATLVLFSCAKEQTSFEVGDIPGKVTVTGCLTYTTGQEYDGKQFTENFMPAAGVTVLVKIENSTLAPVNPTATSAAGVTIYETTTDAEGNYSVEIPAVDTGIQFTVKAQPFTGVRTYVEGFDEKGNVLIKEENVVFSTGEKTGSATPGDIIIKDMMYGYTPRGMAELFDEVEVINGQIGVCALYPTRNTLGQINGKNPYWAEPETGVNVIVEVCYPSTEVVEGNAVLMTRKFGVTTEDDGTFELSIPVTEKGLLYPYISIEPESYVSTFKACYFDVDYESATYNKWVTKSIQGVYEEASVSDYGFYSNYEFPIEGVKETLRSVMMFVPFTEYEDYFNFYDNNYNYNTPWGTKSFQNNN